MGHVKWGRSTGVRLWPLILLPGSSGCRWLLGSAIASGSWGSLLTNVRPWLIVAGEVEAEDDKEEVEAEDDKEEVEAEDDEEGGARG